MPGLPLPSTTYRYRSVVGINPAANTELGDAVPAGHFWWLISATVSCVQGATQTPLPSLIVDDGTNNIYTSAGATGAMTASTTAQFTWGVGLVVSALIGATPNIVATAPLPEFLFIGPGFHIKTLTAGIGANTDYGPPTYYICDFTL